MCCQESKQPHIIGCTNRCIRLLAELLFTKEQNPSLPVITQCLLVKQCGTWHYRCCIRFTHLSRSRHYFQLVFFLFRKLSWVTHQNLKEKPFLSHSSAAQKQVLQGTEITRCSTLVNTNINTIAALDMH